MTRELSAVSFCLFAVFLFYSHSSSIFTEARRDSLGANVSHQLLNLPHARMYIVQLSVIAQAFGGAISVMVGSYVRAQIGFGNSNSTSGATSCSDCRVLITNVSTSNSAALSNTFGKMSLPHALCCKRILDNPSARSSYDNVLAK